MPRECPPLQGLINMRECKAEDVDVDGLPKSASRSKYDLDGGGGSVSLLIRISHKAELSRPATALVAAAAASLPVLQSLLV